MALWTSRVSSSVCPVKLAKKAEFQMSSWSCTNRNNSRNPQDFADSLITKAYIFAEFIWRFEPQHLAVQLWEMLVGRFLCRPAPKCSFTMSCHWTPNFALLLTPYETISKARSPRKKGSVLCAPLVCCLFTRNLTFFKANSYGGIWRVCGPQLRTVKFPRMARFSRKWMEFRNFSFETHPWNRTT